MNIQDLNKPAPLTLQQRGFASQEELDYAVQMYSDFHKETYGSRPNCTMANTVWDKDKFDAVMKSIGEEYEAIRKMERAHEARTIRHLRKIARRIGKENLRDMVIRMDPYSPDYVFWKHYRGFINCRFNRWLGIPTL